MWANEIQNQLATLMQQAIDRKHGKLRDKGIDPRKALLLLYDAFGYASAEDAIAALERVNDYDRFHSIFWAASFSDRRNTTYPDEPGRNGLFLFSSDPHWNRRGTTQAETAS